MATVVTKPGVDISSEIKKLIQYSTEELGQVVIHFTVDNPGDQETWIRIWPTTFLYDQKSAHNSDLVHIENIVYYPNWQICPGGKSSQFTLIFSGLPKSCEIFDFIEHCTNQSGAFEVRDIARSKSDVYYLKM